MISLKSVQISLRIMTEKYGGGSVSKKIDFTAYGIQRDYAQAWELR